VKYGIHIDIIRDEQNPSQYLVNIVRIAAGYELQGRMIQNRSALSIYKGKAARSFKRSQVLVDDIHAAPPGIFLRRREKGRIYAGMQQAISRPCIAVDRLDSMARL